MPNLEDVKMEKKTGFQAIMNQDFDDLLVMIQKDPAAFSSRFARAKHIHESRGIHEETLLHYCAIEGLTEAVRTLLAIGFNPNVRSKFGSTPLMDAALNGHETVVKLLLEARADQEVRDSIGYTVLEKLSLLGGRERIAQVITEHKSKTRLS
jgi:ankyrin repeat protein